MLSALIIFTVIAVIVFLLVVVPAALSGKNTFTGKDL